jgi:polysaccharide chain length determinant protein (PEP-CTERM system associated)
MKIGVNSLQDFMSFLIRRRWWVIAPFLALALLVGLLTKALPRVYVSQALILVKPRDVPENFVMDLTSANSTQQHIKSIQQMLFSRKNLIAIIGEFGKEMPELQTLNMDERVERLTKQIKIVPTTEIDGRGTQRVIAFTISYQNRDAEMARRIAERLTTLFLDEDRVTRQQYVSGTTEFLSNELTKKEKELTESDTSLTALKFQNLQNLPERLEGNQRDLDRLSDYKRANEQNISRLMSARLGYQSLLAQTDEFLPNPTKVSPVQAIKEKDPNVDLFLKAKAEWERQRIIRREGHPDLDTAKLVMDRAKALVPPDVLEEVLNPKPAEEKTAAEEKRTNPAYTHLQNQMRELENEYTIALNEKKAIEGRIAEVSRRIENTPQVELQMTGVVRDNEAIRKERDELNQDLTKAQLSQSLEQRAQGSQFTLVDPANLPIEPEKPNKWAILGIGCAFSLMLAIGFAFIVDLTRQRVWTQSEIETLWGVPVMVDIPAIVSDGDQAELRKKRLAFATFFLAAFAVYGAFLYGVYLNNNYILQQLDPVLQTLVYR